MTNEVTTDYRAIFSGVESTLIRVGEQGSRKADLRQELDEYKTVDCQAFTDADYFRMMIQVVFYSGFKAETVDKKLPVIDNFLSDYNTVADYGEPAVRAMKSDPGMIRNEQKIRACIENARTFRAIVKEYGSFRRYIDAYNPMAAFENIKQLRKDLRQRFAYLSKVTSFHLLTDIGMPVLK